MKLKSSHFLIIICIYFILSFIPIFARWKVEIFPFFSFKLFSKTPQFFEHTDVLLNDDPQNPEFLIHGNDQLTQIDAKFYASKTREMVNRYYENPRAENEKFEMDGYSGRLVILRGDYIEAALRDSFAIEPLGKTIVND